MYIFLYLPIYIYYFSESIEGILVGLANLL